MTIPAKELPCTTAGLRSQKRLFTDSSEAKQLALSEPASLYVSGPSIATDSQPNLGISVPTHACPSSGATQNKERPVLYSSILVPFDFSTAAAMAVKEALRIAKVGGSECRVSYLHVLEADIGMAAPIGLAVPMPPSSTSGTVTRDRIANALTQLGVPGTPDLEIVDGTVWRRVKEAAEVVKADLIVMGTHGRQGLSRLALGSQAEMVLRHSPCPVLILRGQEDDA